ncbi:MAG: A/G-specific adenine glycosylase [Phycisphaerales bacterium]
MASPASERDRNILHSLCKWFKASARDLPWRVITDTGKRDPYRSLVSEIMLQQTQVSRVLEKFDPFIDRFPTLEALAEADEDRVLAMWSGLGYYRRARSLHACAQEAVTKFGRLPEHADELEQLKGIGRYTAGAIASIVHNEPVPIVDGNVERVLLRIEGKQLRSGEPSTRDWCWQRAEELVGCAHKSRAQAVSPSVFNEALMELGALICTPRSPSCLSCPVREQCTAFASSKQDAIPLPKSRKAKKPLHKACLIVTNEDARLLISQRPKGGLWGGLWQVPTLESDTKLPKAGVARKFGVATSAIIREDSFVHETTHRSVDVVVYRARDPVPGLKGRWIGPDETAELATGSLQDRVMRLGFRNDGSGE